MSKTDLASAALVLVAGPFAAHQLDEGRPPDVMTDDRGFPWRINVREFPPEGIEHTFWERVPREGHFDDAALGDPLTNDEIIATLADGTFAHLARRIVKFEDAFYLRTGVSYVNVYHVNRTFGGREEGGWYYNHHDCVASVPVAHVDAEEVRNMMEDRYSYLHDPQPISNYHSRGQVFVYIEDAPRESATMHAPRYE